MAQRTAAKKTAPRKAAKKVSAPLPREGVDDALQVIEHPEEVIPPVVDDDGAAIPASLQFDVDPEDKASVEVSDADVVEFTIEGDTLYAVKPTVEQWGILTTLIASAPTMADRWNAMQQFGSIVLDEASWMYVQNRLLDRDDEFGAKTFDKVVRGLIDHFTPKINRAERRAQARKLAR